MARKSSGKYPNGIERITLCLDKELLDLLRRISDKSESSLSEVILFYLGSIEENDWKLILKEKMLE